MTRVFSGGSVQSSPTPKPHLASTTNLRDRLDQLLGGHYRIERELGGGGMSRAQYELAHDDTTHTSRVIAQLRALPRVPGDPVESVRPGRLAMILDAQLAGSHGQA